MSVIKIGSSPTDEVLITLGDVILHDNRGLQNRFSTPSSVVFPDNAYYLSPDINGNFTKSMVDATIALGEDYIVFDADSLDIHYEESPHVIDTKPTYLYLEGLEGTEETPITLDFRKVNINCFPNANDVLTDHVVFNFKSCQNITLKLGVVEGDKFKRALDTDAETTLENTVLVRSNSGTKNLNIDGGYAAGFMSDMETSSALGSAAIDSSPLSLDYYLQGDGRYESRFYDVDPTLYSTFGLTGGLGYNRLLFYDMEDVTFKFYDISEVFISEITGAQYYGIYEFPATARKMKVNVNPMDGRIENPTNFGHRLEYEPNNGTVIKNMKIYDNHRGGVANIGSNGIIDNCEFYNTDRYFAVPEFGTLASPYSTRYHINCEDVVSRNLTVNNNTFKDKFHKILLTHNINADITNNIFSGSGNNIFIYDLIYGNITGNNFVSTGIVSGGEGTNKSQVIISNNTGSPFIEFTNGANWTNNNFTGADLNGKGKVSGNAFTDSDYSYLSWTKEMHSNTFTGSNSVPYVSQNSYNYNNNFINTGFRFQHGSITDIDVIDGATIDFTATPTNDALYRSTNPVTVVVKNSTLKDAKIYHRTLSQPVDYAEGSWYFEGCNFQDITSYIIKLAINVDNTVPTKFYFKDCTFVGSGVFITKTYGTGLYEIVFDNCTIDANITMPASFTNGTVTMPTIVEPRTQPIPTITYVTDHTEIVTDFHIMTLQIRNKNTLEIVLNKDVNSTYNHYTATPNDFEYSIDGGVYWDSL